MTSFILGLAIGLVVATILVIILHYTVFKNNPKPWLYVIILILFGLGGAAIQLKFFPSAEADVPTPQEQIQNVTKTIKDGWQNTNGGFTFEQITRTQEDDDAPVYEDQVIKLNLYDFGGYVVFSYKDGKVYHNASFYKSSEGLILDGMINMQCEMGRLVWFCKLDFKSFEWIDGRNKAPNYGRGVSWFAFDTDNLISLSSQSTLFWRDRDKWLITNRKQSNKFVLQNAATLTGQNAVDNFTKFANVELISDAESGFVSINTLYNYLYEQCKGESFNSKLLIDVTQLMCVPIPTALQQNFPISEELQEEYNGAEYYGVYNCNIAADVTIKEGNKSKLATKNNVNYIETLKNDENTANQVAVGHIEQENNFAKVNLTFTQTQESDLTGLDLTNSPVTITFTSGTDSKTVRITSIEALNKVNTVLLGANKTWSYTISSNALLFDDFQGSFNLGTSGELEFEYYYLSGYVVASVGLNPVGTVNMAQVNLANYPVRITLANEEDSYQFVFDRTADISSLKTQNLKLGTYSYTISSEQLVFASTSGNLTITTTDRTMLFNFQYVAEDVDIDLRLTTSTGNQGGGQYLWLEFYNFLTQQQIIDSGFSDRPVEITIYNSSNNIIFDQYIISGGNSYNLGRKENIGLTTGETYTIQAKIYFKGVDIVSQSHTYTQEENTYLVLRIFAQTNN